jgi:hypothetical protein
VTCFNLITADSSDFTIILPGRLGWAVDFIMMRDTGIHTENSGGESLKKSSSNSGKDMGGWLILDSVL